MKLEGLKVLDLSAFLPGPHMTMLMADHGADVIMVEPANGRGEPTRSIGHRTSDDVSVWFRNIARGKRSLKINLKDADGHALFMALAKEADVIVEAFRPGVVKRLGVDYDVVTAVNPAIVYCSISAFGQTGQYTHKPAHDLTIQALAGLVDLNRGLEDGKPAAPNLPGADMAASLMALSAILMALLRRHKTGKGDYIDLAMYDALLSWTPNVTGPIFADEADLPVKDMRSFGGAAMYHIYETADRAHLVLGGSEIKFAENLLVALGREDLVEVAKMEPGPAQESLRAFFKDTFASKTLDQWQEFLTPLDVCWAPVRTLKDAFGDPHTLAREMLLKDSTGNCHIGNPIKFVHEPAQPNLTLSDYGEDGEELARDVGLSPEQIRQMRDKGVV